MTDDDLFRDRLSAALSRIKPGRLLALERLSGGANMESWSIDWGDAAGATGYVLRRAPSAEWTASRPFTLADEAGLVRVMAAAGALAPQVALVLTPGDGLGDGYVMARVAAEVAPARILAAPAPGLIDDIAAAMARMHGVATDAVPAAIPVMDTAAAVAELTRRFHDYGGDRPVIALALRWLADHIPPTAPPVLVHGDLRLGNIMANADGLAAILDWELAHIGDAHEDLAYGCMTVWRFGAIDRPAFGLADLDRYFAAYQAAGGTAVDHDRFHFWLVYRTCWWALGCLQMGAIWREGIDAGLERTVIARRTSEQELDLLMLLEESLPSEIRHAELVSASMAQGGKGAPWTLKQIQGDKIAGETSAGEILGAVSDWIASDVKARAAGRDKFLAAVAINALGIVRREVERPVALTDAPLSNDLLSGRVTLTTPGLLARLRRQCLDKIAIDSPKYPALPRARAAWGDVG